MVIGVDYVKFKCLKRKLQPPPMCNGGGGREELCTFSCQVRGAAVWTWAKNFVFSLWQKQLDWKEFWVLMLNAFISKCEQILFLLLPAASLWFPKQVMVSSSSELPNYKSCITSNSHISTFIWCHVDLLLVPLPLWFIILMHFGWITASASDSSFLFFLS